MKRSIPPDPPPQLPDRLVKDGWWLSRPALPENDVPAQPAPRPSAVILPFKKVKRR